MTGDNRTTAEALAEELEIPKDRVLAGVLPKDKVAKVNASGESVTAASFAVVFVFVVF